MKAIFLPSHGCFSRFLQMLFLGILGNCIVILSPAAGQELLKAHPRGATRQLRSPEFVKKPSESASTPKQASPAPSNIHGGEAAPGIPIRLFVRKIQVRGSKVFSAAEIHKITAPYENRELTAEDLEGLRRKLTLLYVKKGYVNSGAVLPDQTVANGVVTYNIIEGRLTDIEIEGNKWLRGGYYKSRIDLGAKVPLNVNNLQKRLQLLEQDNHVRRLHAELKPGVKPGESELAVQVVEDFPIEVYLGFNNYQSPTVGAEQGFATIVDRSLTRNGDTLSFTYGRSPGINPQIDAWYVFPVTPYDTTLSFRYQRNKFDVVEGPFGPLDIESTYDSYEVALRQPLYRTLSQEFALALIGERLHSESSLLGEPFSFAPGIENGKSTISALRFAQDWLYRSQSQVIATRSQLSFGIDALGATVHHDDLPDGEFFSWLGQFQWARIFEPLEIQGIFRIDLQLAADSLLPLEQIPIGGRYSVRGYRENQLVTDNGFIVSLEARLPIITGKRWADYLQLAPFIDYGIGWNTNLPSPDPNDIAGIGIGLRWAATITHKPVDLTPQFEIYWGYPLMDVETGDGNLQDLGIYLQFVLGAF